MIEYAVSFLQEANCYRWSAIDSIHLILGGRKDYITQKISIESTSLGDGRVEFKILIDPTLIVQLQTKKQKMLEQLGERLTKAYEVICSENRQFCTSTYPSSGDDCESIVYIERDNYVNKPEIELGIFYDTDIDKLKKLIKINDLV